MPTEAKPTILIPSRLSSSRLPGKALLHETGKPLIQHVYERALEVKGVGSVIVATDSEEIFNAVRGFGGRVVMTSPEHSCGTDRIAEVARTLESEIIINVQGDEPFFSTDAVEKALAEMRGDPGIDMATVAYAVSGSARQNDPNAVKVVLDREGFALYFSRAPIPYGGRQYLHHLGLYLFRREALFRFTRLAPAPLEKAENLEQLRALENGFRVKIVLSAVPPLDVNTAEDYAAFVSWWREGHPPPQPPT